MLVVFDGSRGTVRHSENIVAGHRASSEDNNLAILERALTDKERQVNLPV